MDLKETMKHLEAAEIEDCILLQVFPLRTLPGAQKEEQGES